MMDLFKKLQGLFGGDNSAEAIEKQMQKMQEQMQAAFGGEETKRGWQPCRRYNIGHVTGKDSPIPA